MEMKLDDKQRMMEKKLFDEEYRTETLRLPERDYSEPGSYFITVCTQGRECIFGNVESGNITLNDFGNIVKQEIYNIENERVEIDVCVIMPNHVHVIITIKEDYAWGTPVVDGLNRRDNSGIISPGCEIISPGCKKGDSSGTASTSKNNVLRRNMILPKIIGKFKMQTAKQINLVQGTPGKSFRQKNYYEHIIRDERDFNRIANYISNNPLKRKNDEYYQ